MHWFLTCCSSPCLHTPSRDVKIFMLNVAKLAKSLFTRSRDGLLLHHHVTSWPKHPKRKSAHFLSQSNELKELCLNKGQNVLWEEGSRLDADEMPESISISRWLEASEQDVCVAISRLTEVNIYSLFFYPINYIPQPTRSGEIKRSRPLHGRWWLRPLCKPTAR